MLISVSENQSEPDFCQGIIKNVDLELTVEALTDELKNQNVYKVRRLGKTVQFCCTLKVHLSLPLSRLDTCLSRFLNTFLVQFAVIYARNLATLVPHAKAPLAV